MRPASLLRPILPALILTLAFGCAPPACARGGGKPVAGPVQTVEPAPSEPPGSWTAGTAPADCTRARRKLWQAGEGWIVKAITTCR